MNYSNAQLNNFDALAQMTLTNFYTLTKNHPLIVLEDFNLKDKNDLFMIRIATIAKDILNKQIRVRCSFWTWLKINWKFRKFGRFKRAREFDATNVNINTLKQFMFPAMKEMLGEEADFGMIYEAFYVMGKEQNYED